MFFNNIFFDQKFHSLQCFKKQDRLLIQAYKYSHHCSSICCWTRTGPVLQHTALPPSGWTFIVYKLIWPTNTLQDDDSQTISWFNIIASRCPYVLWLKLLRTWPKTQFHSYPHFDVTFACALPKNGFPVCVCFLNT